MCSGDVSAVLGGVQRVLLCFQQGCDRPGQVKGETWRVAGQEEPSQHHEEYQHSWCLWRGSALLLAPTSFVPKPRSKHSTRPEEPAVLCSPAPGFTCCQGWVVSLSWQRWFTCSTRWER